MATHCLPFYPSTKINGCVIEGDITKIVVTMEEQPVEFLTPSEPCVTPLYEIGDELLYLGSPSKNSSNGIGFVCVDYGPKRSTFTIISISPIQCDCRVGGWNKESPWVKTEYLWA